MNSILVNNTSLPFNNSHTLTQLVIPNTTVQIKISEEWSIRYYDKLIIAIMKVMNVNNVTYCTNDNYQLITIQGVGEVLIHIVLSYSLN